MKLHASSIGRTAAKSLSASEPYMYRVPSLPSTATSFPSYSPTLEVAIAASSCDSSAKSGSRSVVPIYAKATMTACSTGFALISDFAPKILERMLILRSKEVVEKCSLRAMKFATVVASVSALLLTVSAFAASGEHANYSSVREHAVEVIGHDSRVVIKQDLRSKLVVAVAHTEGRRGIPTCCPPSTSYAGEKAGLVSVFKASGDYLTLVDSSKMFNLPSDSPVKVGAYASEVAIKRADRFTVRMECHQCAGSIAGPLGSTSVRFHFALRGGLWVVSGLDREIRQVVGSKSANPHTQERTLITGTVERVSHNYRTGHRIVWTYNFDESNSRMRLVRKVSTQSKPLRIHLPAFDPASEILGQPS